MDQRIQVGTELKALEILELDARASEASNRTLPRLSLQFCLEFAHLQSLTITYQPHIDLPAKMFAEMSNLTALALPFNKMGNLSIPVSLWTQTQLQSLDLSNNFLTELKEVRCSDCTKRIV